VGPNEGRPRMAGLRLATADLRHKEERTASGPIKSKRRVLRCTQEAGF